MKVAERHIPHHHQTDRFFFLGCKVKRYKEGSPRSTGFHRRSTFHISISNSFPGNGKGVEPTPPEPTMVDNRFWLIRENSIVATEVRFVGQFLIRKNESMINFFYSSFGFLM